MARIALDGIAHSYVAEPRGPQDYALKRLDHVWEDGGAYALLGPSGCGKTTLLNIISGLVAPSEGRLFFDRNDVTDLPTEARNIAQVFQFPVIYDTMTVAENLAFPLRNRGLAAGEVKRRVSEVAGRIGLQSMLDRRARGLTADMKQKVSLGRGLVREDVAAILFDEPLTVIDPHLKWELRSELKRIHRQLGHTMIYVTHDQTEALTFAEKVVVMTEGEVVQIGTPEELFERPRHTFVGYFIGSPGMNVAPAAIDGDRAIVAGHALPLARPYGRIEPGRRVEIGARPEFIRFTRDSQDLPVIVQRVDDIGRFRVVRVTLGDVPLVVMAGEGEEIGTDPRIRFDAAHVHVYADRHLVEPVGGTRLMDRTWNNRAWWMVLPVLLLVAFSAVIPLMTVVNYSVQDTFGNNVFDWVGTEWYEDILSSDRFWAALGRNLIFSAIVLGIEIPLGIAVALAMPRKGWGVPVCLVLMALPLLIPWNVVGTIWQVFGRVDIGLMGRAINALGIDYNYVQSPTAAWATIIVMDVWHWTSLVVLLCYAGLVSIPDAYYQAARIDGASRWSVFRFIQLPKMGRVLLIAVLLRFMDSFMIYTEPFVVTGGGPGNSTTFLSIDLVKMAIGQFDLGPAAAMSIVYFLIILLLSWIFYTVMTNVGTRDAADETAG